MANKYGAQIHSDGLTPESVPSTATQLLYHTVTRGLHETMYVVHELAQSYSKTLQLLLQLITIDIKVTTMLII